MRNSVNVGFDWLTVFIEELTRDVSSSRVDDAVIGQPLSTALQVALVELLRSWNIRPDCVIGHSSGEFAAAYAAGALTFEHALTIAYFRGFYVSRMQHLEGAPDGTMMAIGLSVAQAEVEINALRAGISKKLVVACVNSPSSVTISGNRQAVIDFQEVLEAQGIFARLLKVDVAYHSSDMNLIAEDYLKSIAHCLPSQPPTKVDFWSSVRESHLPLPISELRPEYWIENLISQVKFCQGLGNMAQQTPNLGIIIEASPHSVLDGPIKQTLAAQKLSIPYTSMLKRNVNAVETALQAVQKILDSGVAIDLQKTTFPLLSQSTELLVDLPKYCWDHSTRYWNQSSILTRHHQRAFPYHELLGSRVPQSTSLEPQWRNIINLSALDWLSDHRVNDNIIFPGAGYIAIAIQAFSQHYTEKGFRPAKPKLLEMRDIVFERGLLLDDASLDIEMVCYLRPVFENARETSDSRYEFRVVSSKDGISWEKHCRGTIVALSHVDVPVSISVIQNGVKHP